MKKYTREEHKVIKAAKASLKRAETMTCVQCGYTRFRTVSKAARTFSCRRCKAVYQESN